MSIEKLVLDVGAQCAVSAKALCVACSQPDHLALTETFRCIRGSSQGDPTDAAYRWFDRMLHIASSPCFAFKLSDALLLGTGFQIIASNHFVREARSPVAPDADVAIRASFRDGVQFLDPATTWIICGDEFSFSNHWHWIAMALPALLQSLVYAHELGEAQIGLITPPLTTGQLRTLEIIGLSQCKRLELPATKAFRVPTAIYSSVQSYMNFGRASSCRKLIRDALIKGTDATGIEASPLIYVSRSDTSKRPMLNEPELEDRLKELGFRIVNCGTHTIDEQIVLFANADLVVGPHGAALTNSAFVRPSTAVYELLQASYPNVCSAAMSRIAGCAHVVDFFADDGKASKTDGWQCDIEAVLATVDTLLRRSVWDRLYTEINAIAQTGLRERDEQSVVDLTHESHLRSSAAEHMSF